MKRRIFKFVAYVLLLAVLVGNPAMHAVYAAETNDIEGNGSNADNPGEGGGSVGGATDQDVPTEGTKDDKDNVVPEPIKGKFNVVLKSDDKEVSKPTLGVTKTFFNGLETDSLSFDIPDIEKETRFTLRLGKDSAYVFANDPESKEFTKTVGKSDWTVNTEDNTATYTLTIDFKKIDYVTVKAVFPAGSSNESVTIGGKKISQYGSKVETGKDLDVVSTKSGAKLIPDPLKASANSFLKEAGGGLVFSAPTGTKEATIYLAFQRDIGTYFTVQKAEVGSAEMALKLNDTPANLKLAAMYSIFYGNLNHKSGDFLKDNVALLLLSGNIRKVGDEVTVFSLMSDGTYTQYTNVEAGYQGIDIKVDEFKIGDKVVTGETEPKAEVIMTRKDAIKTNADEKGKFEVKLSEPLKKDEVFTLYSKLEPNKKSEILSLKATKEAEPEKPEIAAPVRIFGEDRYETAVKISEALYPTGSSVKLPNTVIIASGENQADALAAGPLSIALKAPILLVKKDNVPTTVLMEIKRLQAEEAILVGGENAVTSRVENTLKILKLDVKRVFGSNRYETSTKVAELMVKEYGAGKVVLANGMNNVDALAVSGYAAKNNMAIVLTGASELPDSVSEFIKSKEIDKVEIVGGINSVSGEIEKSLGDAFSGRIWGATRFQTALELAKRTYNSPKAMILVNGFTSVDALAAAPYAYANEMPIILTSSDELQQDAASYVKEKGILELTVIGGNNSVSEKVIKEFIQLITPKTEN